MLLCPVLIDISVLLSELYDKFNKQVKQTKQDNVLLEYIVNETDNKEIVIDPMRVRQILENLIGNAIKFTNKGHVRFGFNRIDGNKMQIFVEDTGIGIDEDAQNIIFEKFRQVEIGAVRRFSETGLGLSVSRRLARFMDGDITLKSKVGEGTTFYFTIPCG
jgi:signal transduction histidine kinase